MNEIYSAIKKTVHEYVRKIKKNILDGVGLKLENHLFEFYWH